MSGEKCAGTTYSVKRLAVMGLVAVFVFSSCGFLVPSEDSEVTSETSESPLKATTQEAIDSPRWSNYANFWFDDRTLGTMLGGGGTIWGFSYSGVPTYGNVTVNNSWDGERICMKMNKTSAGVALGIGWNREIFGNQNMTWWWAASSMTSGAQCYIYNGSDLLMYVGMDSAGFKFYNGTTYDTVEVPLINTWYRWAVEMDLTTQTATIKVNDTILWQDVGFNPLYYADALTQFQFRLGASVTGLAYIDNLQYWWEDTNSYDSDDTYDLVQDCLEHYYDRHYNEGGRNLTSPGCVLEDLYSIGDDAQNRSWPRMGVSSAMYSAIKFFKWSGEARWYDFAVDLGDWLVEVSQQPEGYFSHYGGTGHNQPDNHMTTSITAMNLLELYNLTGSQKYLDSANEGFDFIISDCWNTTTGLLQDSPDDNYTRLNLNAMTAAALAYSYYLNENATHGSYAAAILTNMLSYMQDRSIPTSGNWWEYSFENRCWYPYDTDSSTYQGSSYEVVTAMNYAEATYWMNEAGWDEDDIETWTWAFMREAYTVMSELGFYQNSSEGTWEYQNWAWIFVFAELLSGNDSALGANQTYVAMHTWATTRANCLQYPNGSMPVRQNATVDVYDGIESPYYALGNSMLVRYVLKYIDIWQHDYVQFPDYLPTWNIRWNYVTHDQVVTMNITTITPSAQAGTAYGWSASLLTDGSMTWYVYGLDDSTGYKVYQDGVVITTGTGPSFSFTATGGGEFEVVVWNTKTVSTLVVLTINMIGLGIMVSVVVGWVLPFSRDIAKGRFRSTDQMVKELIHGVVFIVVGCFMYVMLYQVAIG